MDVKFSPQSIIDLDDVWSHVYKHDFNFDLADKVTYEIEKFCLELLPITPKMGIKQDNISKGLYRFRFRSYHIYYRIKNDSIEIVRIINTERRIDNENF